MTGVDLRSFDVRVSDKSAGRVFDRTMNSSVVNSLR
jgi:hypothetical protein